MATGNSIQNSHFFLFFFFFKFLIFIQQILLSYNFFCTVCCWMLFICPWYRKCFLSNTDRLSHFFSSLRVSQVPMFFSNCRFRYFKLAKFFNILSVYSIQHLFHPNKVRNIELNGNTLPQMNNVQCFWHQIVHWMSKRQWGIRNMRMIRIIR